MKQEIIYIQNLKCSGCANSIVQSLKAFPEVSDVRVDVEDACVNITTQDDTQREKYEDALIHAGYPPVGFANPLHRQAKSYVSCAIGRMSN